MSTGYAQILVQVGTDASAPRRLKVAANLARDHGASLVGVRVHPDQPVALLAVSGEAPVSRRSLAAFAAQDEVEADARARQARAVFEAEMAGAEIGAEWREFRDPTCEMLMRAARTADLLIVPEPSAEDRGAAFLPAERLVLEGGGPVFLVPGRGVETSVGQRIIVAWDAGREAARAMHDALPMLRKAKSVMGVIAGNGEATRGAEAPLSAFFERHGVAGSVTRLPQVGENTGEVLLRYAAAWEADLIVMGLYGRSRLREFVFGGVSRYMLERSPFPLLLSH